MTFKQWRHVSDGARLPSSAWDIFHHGYCQTHNLEKGCSMAKARAVLEEVEEQG